MLDAKDLKRFFNLPPIFNKAILADIEQALDEYDAFNAYAMDMLDFYGVDAFKNPDAYDETKLDVMNLHLPKPTEIKILAILDFKKREYCGGKNEQQT